MNYAEIKAATLGQSSYSNRSDSDLNALFDTFLRMVEARINRRLKTEEMQVRASIATIADKEYYALPADFGGLVDIEIRATDSSKDRIPMTKLTTELMNSTANQPDKFFYSIIANQLQISTQQEGYVLEVVYYRKVPALTSASSNWLADNHCDCYVSGVMAEIYAALKNFEVSSAWNQRLSMALDEVLEHDNLKQFNGTFLQMQVIG